MTSPRLRRLLFLGRWPRWLLAATLLALAARASPAPAPPTVPARLADPGAAALLHAGDRVDVIAAPGELVAADLLVLAVPADGGADERGALVLFAAPEVAARRLAGFAVRSQLSVT